MTQKYIIEVGYEKVYKRTQKEHLKILQDYEQPKAVSGFHNKWRKASEIALTLNAILSVFNQGISIHMLPRLSMASDTFSFSYDSTLATYSLHRGLSTLIATSYILNKVIPITPASKYKDGILFIPGHTKQFKPNNQNQNQNQNQNKNKNKNKNQKDVVININPEEFDRIINDMASAYGGDQIAQNTQKTNNKIQTIMYAFDIENASQIKRFLYGLPINVFLLNIYKVEDERSQNNILLFPRKSLIKNENIKNDQLTAMDEKIIEYGETQVAIYNKVNNNITYLAEYVKPLRYFNRLLPKYFRVPEFSPM